MIFLDPKKCYSIYSPYYGKYQIEKWNNGTICFFDNLIKYISENTIEEIKEQHTVYVSPDCVFPRKLLRSNSQFINTRKIEKSDLVVLADKDYVSRETWNKYIRCYYAPKEDKYYIEVNWRPIANNTLPIEVKNLIDSPIQEIYNGQLKIYKTNTFNNIEKYHNIIRENAFIELLQNNKANITHELVLAWIELMKSEVSENIALALNMLIGVNFNNYIGIISHFISTNYSVIKTLNSFNSRSIQNVLNLCFLKYQNDYALGTIVTNYYNQLTIEDRQLIYYEINRHVLKRIDKLANYFKLEYPNFEFTITHNIYENSITGVQE